MKNTQSVSHFGRAFWNIHSSLPDSQNLDSSMIWMDKFDDPENNSNVKAVYFQPSPGINSNKLFVLNELSVNTVNFGIDPYSLGLWESQLFKVNLDSDVVLTAIGKNYKFFRFSGQAYAMSGAADFQEIALLLASIVQVVEDYEGVISLEQLAQTLSLELSLKPHLFESVAKVRAVKCLLKSISETVNSDKISEIDIYSAPNLRFLGAREPWTNILRLSAMQSAAVIGGSDGFLNVAYDFNSKNQGARVSRNSLEVLLQESHLAQVQDPLCGSEVLESMTEQLCEKSWVLFTEILKKGGLKDCLRSGWIFEIIDENEKHENLSVLNRDKVLTGINQYPLVSSLDAAFPLVEKEEVIDIERWWSQNTLTDGFEKLCDVKRFVPKSLAQVYEQQQMQTQKISEKSRLIPVLVESSECKNKKWSTLRNLLSLTGFSIEEKNLEQAESVPLVLLMASDPDGDFVKNSLEKLKKSSKTKVFWVGDRLIQGFDGCVGESQNMIEISDQIYSILGGQ